MERKQASLITPCTLSGFKFPDLPVRKQCNRKQLLEVCLPGPGDQGDTGNLPLPLMSGTDPNGSCLKKKRKKKKKSFSLFSYYVLNQDKNSIPDPLKQQSAQMTLKESNGGIILYVPVQGLRTIPENVFLLNTQSPW